MKLVLGLVVGLLISVLPIATAAQTAQAILFRNERTNPAGRRISGELFIKTDLREIKVADDVIAAWIIDEGRSVVFSTPDARGQSLMIRNVAAGKSLKLATDAADFDGLTEVRLTNGSLVLLARLSDPESGEPFAAVIDPRRGRLLRRRAAEFTAVRNNLATISYYRSADWETMFEQRQGKDDDNNSAIPLKTSVRAIRKESLDLMSLMKSKAVPAPE